MSTAPEPVRPNRLTLRSTMRRPLGSRATTSALVHAAYVLPALAVMTLVLLVPLAMTMGLSLSRWDGLGPITWAGGSNYVAFLQDDLVIASLRNAVVLTIFTSAIPILLGLATAIVLSRIGARLRTAWRTLLFLPAVIAPVVVAVGWRLVYEPSRGLLNGWLDAVGLGEVARPWLGDFALALPATGVVATWMEYGLVMVLFLAGIQRIPLELYDAAKVDGASLLGEIRSVTLPSLRPEILVAIVITLIDSFRNFALVFNLTRGGPGSATVVPVMEVYRRGILHGEVGSASALGVTLTAIILAIAIVALVIARRRGFRE